MFDYIFSHKILADEFCVQLTSLSIHTASRNDDLGFVVSIPEDMDDAVADQVEDIYDSLMEKSEKMLDAESEMAGKHVAAITVNLNDGRVAQVAVRPELMNKILGALTFEELNELVEAITEGVEQPDNRPLCQR